MLKLAEAFSRDGVSFSSTYQNLVPQPWVIDDLDTFKINWSKKSWKKARLVSLSILLHWQVIIFVDNSGAYIILGILPFARELLRHGSQVILAANDLPSINDVTYSELIEIVSKVIDLTGVSQELAYHANASDFVILEGMGRGIETNLYAQFKCDSLKIAMVKHVEVAEFLGSRLYDCVIKYDEV
ncbi:hypothetical protein Fmac_024259 [Flemingia macrophylla]|uniref:Damage-control phosphatase ARMT1-like metal-binding domain-containing protein n=1 Tax=Flemingia macrophylla TaxID=520843 RepID=A0ABD1LNW6_9FABA